MHRSTLDLLRLPRKVRFPFAVIRRPSTTSRPTRRRGNVKSISPLTPSPRILCSINTCWPPTRLILWCANTSSFFLGFYWGSICCCLLYVRMLDFFVALVLCVVINCYRFLRQISEQFTKKRKYVIANYFDLLFFAGARPCGPMPQLHRRFLLQFTRAAGR
jgi:hypothetical protein